MHSLKSSLLFFLCIIFGFNSAFSQFKIETYALESVTLIDANHQIALPNQTILIKGNSISKIFPDHSIQLPDSLTLFHLPGKFVIPGLIDTHVHLATNPSEKTRPEVESVLNRMLLSGVTSVRDMAGDARMLAGLSRDARVGDIVSPNIYYAALMAGPAFFKDARTMESSQGAVNGKLPFMKAITDSTNFVLAIAEAKGTGATGIKLYEQLSSGLVKKVVEEATKQDMQVWGHAALFPAKPSEIINAGVHVISHSEMLYFEKYPTRADVPKEWAARENPDASPEYWDEEINKLNLDTLFILMKKKGTILDATQSAYLPMIKKYPKLRWKGEISTRITKKAYQSGVKICTGSDTDQEYFIQQELKLLVKYCGFSPIDAIIASTKNASEAIGIFQTHGTIEENKIADLLVLDKNPLEDINNIDAVNMVIKSGKLYKKE